MACDPVNSPKLDPFPNFTRDIFTTTGRASSYRPLPLPFNNQQSTIKNHHSSILPLSPSPSPIQKSKINNLSVVALAKSDHQFPLPLPFKNPKSKIQNPKSSFNNSSSPTPPSLSHSKNQKSTTCPS
jgi:hypothetical protein